jgi:hypothetical protein
MPFVRINIGDESTILGTYIDGTLVTEVNSLAKGLGGEVNGSVFKQTVTIDGKTIVYNINYVLNGKGKASDGSTYYFNNGNIYVDVLATVEQIGGTATWESDSGNSRIKTLTIKGTGNDTTGNGNIVNSRDELFALSPDEILARLIYQENQDYTGGQQNAIAWSIVNRIFSSKILHMERTQHFTMLLQLKMDMNLFIMMMEISIMLIIQMLIQMGGKML